MLAQASNRSQQILETINNGYNSVNFIDAEVTIDAVVAESH